MPGCSLTFMVESRPEGRNYCASSLLQSCSKEISGKIQSVCRDPGNDKENEAQEPQSAVTVTETFPDGTSEPESEASQAAEADEAPGA